MVIVLATSAEIHVLFLSLVFIKFCTLDFFLYVCVWVSGGFVFDKGTELCLYGTLDHGT